MKRKIMTGVAVAAILTAGLATPAFADSYVVDGTSWNLQTTSAFGIDQAGDGENAAPYAAYAGDEYSLKVEDPSSPGNYLDLDCASPATATVETDGDQLVDCNDPTSVLGGDLTWDADVKIFSGDYAGLVGRVTYVLTNASGSPLTLNLRYLVDTEECNQGVGNISTSTGDLVTDNTDSWLLCNNNNKSLEGIAWGDNWATDVSNESLQLNPTTCDECYIDSNGFALGAGQTVTLVFFLYAEGATDHGASYGTTDVAQTANMTSYFDVTTLGSTRLWEGLTTADNWTLTSSSTDAPALANTGLDVSALVLAAFALAGLGAVLIVRRRAKA